MRPLRKIDDFLNGVTMHKLVSVGLSSLAVVALVFSATDLLAQNFWGLLISLALITTTCFVSNHLIARSWKVPYSSDSYLITALILFFILPPATTLERGIMIVAAGLIAMASKYMIARHGKHLFNPAAFSATILGLLGLIHASWWVGSSVLWPFTLILGLLVVRKIRRFSMVSLFALLVLVITVVDGFSNNETVFEAIKFAVTQSPLIFLATIMLTEPSTTPPKRNSQFMYATIVGLLYSFHPEIGSLYVYPEIALIIGNVYAYLVSPKYRSKLKLKKINQVSENVYDYVFSSDQKIKFEPGQYLEWTLDHKRIDLRGNRRTFSIASSPTEEDIHLGVKFYPKSSSYKNALKNMDLGDIIYAGQLSGDFVLPVNAEKKLVFIAGGIGITPFRSMLKYLVDINEPRDIHMYYLVADKSEIAFLDILKAAELLGIKITIIDTSKLDASDKKLLSGELIANSTPDFNQRAFYLSGPKGMVDSTKDIVKKLGVPRSQIVTDYFSGY